MSLRQRARKQSNPRRLDIQRSQVRILMDPVNFYGGDSPLTFRMRRPLNLEGARRRRIVLDDAVIDRTPVRVLHGLVQEAPEPKTPVYKHTRAWAGLLDNCNK